ncbi:hypothetical protein AQ860_11325 [Burkholderia pseudomallei]|nr:hypothetical protein AQ760_17540 [Burkholderia pseudomallei]OMZ16419.1 hypothetical protein AQ859_13070 [Burkholderia pseudomallei]OMZ37307.1 hypothetical protein AQ860_11325 [Burkholderia pseudomallei]
MFVAKKFVYAPRKAHFLGKVRGDHGAEHLEQPIPLERINIIRQVSVFPEPLAKVREFRSAE